MFKRDAFGSRGVVEGIGWRGVGSHRKPEVIREAGWLCTGAGLETEWE